MGSFNRIPGKSGRVMTCVRCGLIFYYTGTGDVICPNCREADREDFDRVKEYFCRNPKSNIAEIAEGTGVSMEATERFFRSGRIEMASDSNIFTRCERCHKEIPSGRFCTSCTNQLAGDIKQAFRADRLQGRGMYYRRREK